MIINRLQKINFKLILFFVFVVGLFIYYQNEILGIKNLFNWKVYYNSDYSITISYPKKYEIEVNNNELHISNLNISKNPKNYLYIDYTIKFDNQYYQNIVKNYQNLKQIDEKNIIYYNNYAVLKLSDENYYPRSIYEYWIVNSSNLKNIQIRILFYKSRDPIKNAYYSFIFNKIKNSIVLY